MPPVAVDLTDAALFQAAPPHGAFAALRASAPVSWTPEPQGGPGFWSVTRHADIVSVSTDPQTYSSAAAVGGHRIFDEDTSNPALETSMISMDPPEHLEHRRTVMGGFTPARLQQMEAGIRARGVRLIEQLKARWQAQDGQPIDFVEGFAAPYAIQTLAELFGVSETDGDRLFAWSNAVVAEEDPELRPSQAVMDQMIGEMAAYSMQLWADRRANPGPDLISMLANARIGGAEIRPGQYLATFILLVVAGNETTRNSLTGGLLALDAHPDQRAAAMADPGLLRSGAQEIVRWVTPVHMRRTALRDTELGGQAIAKGDKLVMWYTAANRDNSVWPDADRFRMDRFTDPAVPKHVGFGTGQHVCLGQRLAELQIRVAYEELFDRLPGLKPVGPGRRVRSNFINGWKDLPVTLG